MNVYSAKDLQGILVSDWLFAYSFFINSYFSCILMTYNKNWCMLNLLINLCLFYYWSYHVCNLVSCQTTQLKYIVLINYQNSILLATNNVSHAAMIIMLMCIMACILDTSWHAITHVKMNWDNVIFVFPVSFLLLSQICYQYHTSKHQHGIKTVLFQWRFKISNHTRVLDFSWNNTALVLSLSFNI